MKQIAIVTGATGYVGQSLANALFDANWTVYCVVRNRLAALETLAVPGSNIIVYDGSYESLLQLPDCHDSQAVLFHLASQASYDCPGENVTQMLEANITFGTQLLEAMGQLGVDKLINTGSYWQYDQTGGYDPVCLYAATKQAFDNIIQYYTDSRNINCITLTLFEVYGINDPRKKLLALLAHAKSVDAPIQLSPGLQKLDMTYISDVTAAYQIAAQQLMSTREGKVNQCYAINSGTTVTLQQLISQYEQVHDTQLNIAWGARPYRQNEVMSPWQPAPEDHLKGWQALVGLKEGLAMIKDNENKKGQTGE